MSWLGHNMKHICLGLVTTYEAYMSTTENTGVGLVTFGIYVLAWSHYEAYMSWLSWFVHNMPHICLLLKILEVGLA